MYRPCRATEIQGRVNPEFHLGLSHLTPLGYTLLRELGTAKKQTFTKLHKTMLTNTFSHIKGITTDTEKDLWNAEILTWDDFLNAGNDDGGFGGDLFGNATFTPTDKIPMPLNKQEKMAQALEESKDQLRSKAIKHFAEGLPDNRHWRLFPHFRKTTVYLDIETTGLDKYQDEITTIALYDGTQVFYYVNDPKQDKYPGMDKFKEDIAKYEVIITYNGKTFDAPFLRHKLDIPLDHIHIDLRYVLKNLGFTGGLKEIEKKLGLDRGDISYVDGFFGTLLWKEYQLFQNDDALETLLAYNVEDVVNLEILMIKAYNMMLRVRPVFSTNRISDPIQPEAELQVHMPTILQTKEKYSGILGLS